MDDPWSVLGVRKDADMEAIQASYEALKNKHKGDEESQEILDAAYSAIRKQKHNSDYVAFNCSECGQKTKSSVEKALESGTENLICTDCSNRGFPSKVLNGQYREQIFTYSYLCLIGFALGLHGLVDYTVLGSLSAAIGFYLMYLSQKKNSYAYAGLGLYVSYKSILILFGLYAI